MSRPERIVMSMAPNRQYLEGYNACVEDTAAYIAKLEQAIVTGCESSDLDLAYMQMSDVYTDIKARQKEDEVGRRIATKSASCSRTYCKLVGRAGITPTTMPS